MIGAKVFGSSERHWKAVIERVRQLHALGAPVLLGTRTVASSIEAGERLAAAGLPHQVLNARQDEGEAEIVSEAGQRGAITVATNMAGRGTDIKLGPGVEELGGLHVIMIERHEARRIDRQLAGRSGRQGQRGRFEPILSIEDPILADGGGKLIGGACPHGAGAGRLARGGFLHQSRRSCASRARTRACASRCCVPTSNRPRRWRFRDAENSRAAQGFVRDRGPGASVARPMAQEAELFDCVATPAGTVKLGSPVTGLLGQVNVRRGDQVKAGDEVARLESSVEEASVRLAEIDADAGEGDRRAAQAPRSGSGGARAVQGAGRDPAR